MHNKLMEFVLKEAGENKEDLHFIAYGNFNTKTSECEKFPIPLFSNIALQKVVDGNAIDWTPTATTWAGIPINGEDAMESMLGRFTANDETVEVLYLNDEIQKFVAQYKGEIAFEYEGHKIPKYIYHGFDGTLDLAFATDHFCYYGLEDLIMLRTNNGELVSDNAFAEIGLFESVQGVKEGEEKHLYGDMPAD